jgi:hypothetical protein
MKTLTIRTSGSRRRKTAPPTAAKLPATPSLTAASTGRSRERWLLELLGLALTGLVVIAIALAGLAEVAKTATAPPVAQGPSRPVGQDREADASASPLRDERLCCRETR